MRKPREESYVTIKDVAKKADVSIATVSRVINDGKVSENRKKKVLDAIKELDYVPNNSARNLASVNSTKRISLIVPTISYQCYTDLIKGFKTGARLYKYDPLIEEYDFDIIKYQAININVDKSSEIKGLVQIGEHIENARKVVIDIKDDLLQFELSEQFHNKSAGIFFEQDEYFAQFFSSCIFSKGNASELTLLNLTDEYDYYLTQTIEQACKLINNGILKPIYVMENTTEISKLITNIHHFPIDFYAIGLGLSRIVIKRLNGKITDEENPLIITIA